MTPTRPFLIRAFYEWIVENDCTPHIVVNAEAEDVDVPEQYVEGGQIVLNIAMTAVQNLELSNEFVSFQARFSGIARSVYVPVQAVMAIYARENGRGMVFAEEEMEQSSLPPTGGDDDDKKSKDKKGGSKGTKSSGRPHLTIVK